MRPIVGTIAELQFAVGEPEIPWGVEMHVIDLWDWGDQFRGDLLELVEFAIILPGGRDHGS